ncbi:MAG: tRNA (adenosine(37)-N6)-threonylcarbamoyltransferase complex ATPase subunit type 1 TsaE [Geminicoccus sp.]|nr:tRNA (adenosine(37)-N6)-threonylcarbamoyltransferase complex ATPase subunit type 1 TsaE [Geminicoccus sp.]
MGSLDRYFVTIFVDDEAGTARLAARLASALGVGDVVLLEGTLGAGKTAFSRALIRSVLGDPDALVASPTFTFSQIYNVETLVVTHFDLYRVGEAAEVFDLGWDDAIADGVTLVEWPDRLQDLRPAEALTIKIELHPDVEEARTFHFSGPDAWANRLAGGVL